MTGFSTNADVTVAEGDVIAFEVNDGGAGTNVYDEVSWSPNIVYTHSSGGGGGTNLLNNPSWVPSGSPDRLESGWEQRLTPTSIPPVAGVTTRHDPLRVEHG